jgi:hypothetical protein
MKRFLILLSLLFCNVVFADTINLHWLNEDGTVYENSTCVIDSDLILPSTPPTKYGYTFTGWKLMPLTQIEYLEATGTQWIDTGVSVGTGSIVEVKYKFNHPASSWRSLYGNTRIGNSRYMFSFTMNYDSQMLSPSYDVFYDIRYNVDTDVHTVRQESENFYIDNVLVHAAQQSVFTNPSTLCLFSRERGALPFIGNIYFAKIWDSNNTLVRDMIPVLDEDGTPCMFDTVEGKFYYNAGTGQFIAGPVL